MNLLMWPLRWKKSLRKYRAYSRSNRKLDLKIEDNKLYLFNSQGKPIIPLKMIKKDENIKPEIEEMGDKLRIEILN